MEAEMKKKLASYIHKFSSKKVAVVGDLALDWYVFGTITRVNPEMPHAPLLKVSDQKYALGCAGNVAANLASLGAKVSLYSVIGEDSFEISVDLGKQKTTIGENNGPLQNYLYNQILKGELQKFKIEGVFFKEGDTLVKQRLKEKDHNGYIARLDHNEPGLKPISNEAREDLFGKLMSRKDLDAIVLSDYNKTMFGGGFSQSIITWANNWKIPVFADPKPANIGYFKGTTMIRPNEREAREMTGMKDDEDVTEVLEALRKKTSSKYVIITRGKNGMLVGSKGNLHDIATRVREVVDVVGAGDTVLSALALGMASGTSVIEAAHIANYAAGVVVEKSGTATVTQAELKERILA